MPPPLLLPLLLLRCQLHQLQDQGKRKLASIMLLRLLLALFLLMPPVRLYVSHQVPLQMLLLRQL